MAKKYYLPRGEYAKLSWLNNFDGKLYKYSDTFNLTDDDIDTIHQYKLSYNYGIALMVASKAYSKQCTSLKTMITNGKQKKNPISVPLMVMPPDAPTELMTGTFTYISKFVKKLKVNSGYSENIGKDLDIIGVERNTNDNDDKFPVLSFKVTAEFIHLKYIKGNNDGAIIESKRGAETTFSLLEKVTKPTYIDKRPNLIVHQPEERQYRACFFKNDNVLGKYSSVISVVVN